MELRQELDKLIAAVDARGVEQLAELVGATWFERVKQLKKDWTDSDIKSAGQYAKDYERLVKQAGTQDPRGLLAFAARKTTKADSLRKYRAAIKWGTVQPLKEAMRAVFREADRMNAKARKAAKGGPLADAFASIHSGIVYEEKLAAIASKLDSLPEVFEEARAKPNKAAPKKEQTHSQRARLSKLPDDWQVRMLARMNRGRGKQPGKWATHAAASVLVGARPCELGQLWVSRNGPMLLVTVRGAKQGSVTVPSDKGERLNATTGRKLRQFLFDPSKLQGPAREAAAKLFDQAPADGQELHLAESGGFGSAWRAAAAREFGPELAPSAYANRHQFASELKGRADSIEPGLPDKLTELRQDIAAALGHASTATQKVYGRPSHSRLDGMEGLVSVTATGTARDTTPQKPPRADGGTDGSGGADGLGGMNGAATGATAVTLPIPSLPMPVLRPPAS